MIQGRVLWYCDAIGYGFIQPDEGGGKILVPRRDIDGSEPSSLENGAKVTYEAIQGREGMEAKRVSMVFSV
jgi:CspA family cold shock protein